MYPWDAYSRVSYQKYTPIQKNVMGEFGRIHHLCDIGADEAREVRSRLGPEAQVLDVDIGIRCISTGIRCISFRYLRVLVSGFRVSGLGFRV